MAHAAGEALELACQPHRFRAVEQRRKLTREAVAVGGGVGQPIDGGGVVVVLVGSVGLFPHAAARNVPMPTPTATKNEYPVRRGILAPSICFYLSTDFAPHMRDKSSRQYVFDDVEAQLGGLGGAGSNPASPTN